MEKNLGGRVLKKIRDFISSLKWVLFVSRRFSRVDRKGRSRVNSMLSSLGICFGVMTLITVISVMNGFQMSFIDAIMEVSSYHVRISGVDKENTLEFEEYVKNMSDVKTFFPFYEAQSLMVGRNNSQAAALIRAIPADIMERDDGFKKEAKVWSGYFDLQEEDSIILGTDLARRLGLRSSSEVNLFALSGGNDVKLLSSDRIFKVKALVRTGYADINSSYAFISLKDGQKYLGDTKLLYALKLYDSGDDEKVVNLLKKSFPTLEIESWKSYNRSFFTTLKIEKNLLFLLVFIIFIVVAVNIFNAMRRMVYERREEISVFSALGGTKKSIQSIFIMQGFITGIKGALPGLVLGLLLSIKISTVFMIMSKIVYFFQIFIINLISPVNVQYIRENPMYMIYANIPPRIFAGEVLLITVFGIFSALLASWTAGRAVLKLTVAEVMRDE